MHPHSASSNYQNQRPTSHATVADRWQHPSLVWVNCSDVMDIPTLVSIAGALGLGSIVGQFVSAGKDRRAARAAALQAINDVEEARWAPAAEGAPSFSRALHGLYTAALIAQVPRRPLRAYLTYAQAAQWESARAWNEEPDPEQRGGGIDTQFADTVREAARTLIAAVWAPRGLRWLRTYRMVRRLEQRAAEIRDKDVRRTLSRAEQVVL